MAKDKDMSKNQPAKKNDDLATAGYKPTEKGYQPIKEGYQPVADGPQPAQGNLDTTKPPQGGSGVPAKALDASKAESTPNKDESTKQG